MITKVEVQCDLKASPFSDLDCKYAFKVLNGVV